MERGQRTAGPPHRHSIPRARPAPGTARLSPRYGPVLPGSAPGTAGLTLRRAAGARPCGGPGPSPPAPGHAGGAAAPPLPRKHGPALFRRRGGTGRDRPPGTSPPSRATATASRGSSGNRGDTAPHPRQVPRAQIRPRSLWHPPRIASLHPTKLRPAPVPSALPILLPFSPHHTEPEPRVVSVL